MNENVYNLHLRHFICDHRQLGYEIRHGRDYETYRSPICVTHFHRHINSTRNKLIVRKNCFDTLWKKCTGTMFRMFGTHRFACQHFRWITFLHPIGKRSTHSNFCHRYWAANLLACIVCCRKLNWYTERTLCKAVKVNAEREVDICLTHWDWSAHV